MSHSPSSDLADHEAALEARAGGSLSREGMAYLLGIDQADVDQRRRARSLLALPRGDEWVYPRVQFHETGTIPCLAEVVEGLEVSGPWVTLDFLVTNDNALGGLTPRNRLVNGGAWRHQVMAILRGYREGEGFS